MVSPEVTIVIPTHNRWPVLRSAALPAALSQVDVNHEVIVVDDGSRDETSTRLAEIEIPYLRVIRHERPLGVAQARNAGIFAATGEWVALLDDDDVWAPFKLRRQIDLAVSSEASWTYAASAALDEQRHFLFSLEPADPEVLASELLRWNVLWGGSSNVVVRRDVLARLSGFDQKLFQLADWDLWIRLALAERAATSDEILLGCVMHRESMLATDRRDVFREIRYLVEKHRAASDAYGVEFDLALFSRWVALGHRTAGRRWQAARTYARGAWRHRDFGALPRAVASLLGERTIELGRSFVSGTASSAECEVESPDWLDRYHVES
jgi:glycosyltransferase involved in cell wall biosynthesis